MVRKVTLFALFLVSYIPLFFILAIQNLNISVNHNKTFYQLSKHFLKVNILSDVLILISLLSLIYYFVFIYINSKGGFRNHKKVTKLRNSGVEYLSYLATYIIPFLGLKFDSWNNLLATTLLFLVIGFIYTKTNLLYANPTLALFGHYLYQVTFDDGDEKTVLCKGKLKKDNIYKYKILNDDLYFIKIDKL